MKSIPIIGISRHRLATDGEGITTLVAFHGCPLRCKYCLNPQCHTKKQIFEIYTPETLYKEVIWDELYFLATGGGITFGGGEPCLQSNFIKEFRSLCGERWKLNIETSLNVNHKHIERLLPIINQYIIDIKDMNPHTYLNYTGQSNRKVIKNLQLLIEAGKANQIIIRIPRIPGYNSQDDIQRSLDQLKAMGLSLFDIFQYKKINNLYEKIFHYYKKITNLYKNSHTTGKLFDD